MGRLPQRFAGRDITFRLPYEMPGELEVEANQSGIVFPEATFLHNIDKPFEIHRVFVRLTGRGILPFVAPPLLTVLEPQPDTLEQRIRLRFADTSKNENLTKATALVELLLARNTGVWEWDEPYTLVRSEGFQVQIDSQDFPSICVLDDNCIPVNVPVARVRVAVAFQGFLVVIAPPSETR